MDLHVAVVGASLGGLSVANVLHRLGARVEVFECFGHGFHTRGGALGAVDVELVRQIRGDGNRSGRIHPIKGHGHFYGDLWQYFYEGLPEGTVHFGVDVQEIQDSSSDSPQLVLGDGPRHFDIIVGADGGKSTVRKYVTDQLPKYAGYTVWRGLVPMAGIDGSPSGSATIRGAQYATLGFPCAGPAGTGDLWNCGIYMLMPEADVEAPSRNRQVKSGMKSVPDWFVPFIQHFFGARNAKFWQQCIQHGKVSPHPVWELAADRVVAGRIVLLGDAAHMASPRTGAGAYTAMCDAVMLGEALQNEKTLDAALRMYNSNTVQRGKQLYRRSREAAMSFAPRSCEPVSPLTLLEDALGHKLKDALNVNSSSEGKHTLASFLPRALVRAYRSSTD
jgi:2-polyprenyl-6-methoxyphenol hydroxylase-like FAD-dependent oxidoreductase